MQEFPHYLVVDVGHGGVGQSPSKEQQDLREAWKKALVADTESAGSKRKRGSDENEEEMKAAKFRLRKKSSGPFQ